jgi:hypothetical protein
MKKQLPKKIYAFITLLFSYLCANAQIVYTDVNPDITSTGTYNLDLNNDGITDFIIAHTTSTATHQPCGTRTSNFIKITPQGSNAIISSGNFPVKLSNGSTINSSSLTWNNTANQVLTESFWNIITCQSYIISEWYSVVDGYLGFKLILNNNTYYGWARLNTTAASTFTIQDYAFNSIPNQPILAGETTCTIPTVNLTQSGSLSFCNGDSVTLTANGTGYQYLWKKNNVNIAGATNKTYTAKTAGIYKCKVTNSCGSKTSGTRTVIVPCRNSNENFVEALDHLSVYPNPATNSIIIKFPSDEAGEISIVNLFGQIVYIKNLQGFQNLEGLNEMKIDISKFPAGIYIARWNSGENNETKTFSVIK